MSQTIEETLLVKRESGKKSLVVYLTGGLDEHFDQILRLVLYVSTIL